MIYSACCTVTVGLLVCISAECAATEPKQSLATLVENLRSTDSELRERAIKALFKPIAGLTIEYWMMDWLKDAREFRRQSKPLLGDLIKLLRHQDEEVVETAIMLITRLGIKARTAVPALRQVANDEHQPASVRWQAAQAMFFVTPETVPVIPLLLAPPDSTSTIFTIYSSTNFIANSEVDIANIEVLQRMSVPMLAAVVTRLLITSGHTKVEVPYLIKATAKDYPALIRAISAMMFGEMGPEARAAIPTLRSLLSDDDAFVRRCAAIAVLRIQLSPRLPQELADELRLKDPDRKEFLENAREVLKDHQDEHKAFLAYVKEDPESGLLILTHQIRFGRGPARRKAIRILGDVRSAAKSAVPYLINTLSDEDLETRKLAANALRLIAPSATRAPSSQCRKQIQKANRARKNRCSGRARKK